MTQRKQQHIRSQLAPLAGRVMGPREPRVLAVLSRVFGSGHAGDQVELPVERVHALHDELALATGDPMLGYNLALALPEGGHGIVEYFWRSARTVEEAASEAARVSSLLRETPAWSWRRKARSGVLGQRVAAHPHGMGRHANEFVVTTILREIEKLTGEPARPIRVMYEHDRGAPGIDYRALHHADVCEFGAAMTGVELADDVLARAIKTASPALLDTLRHHVMARIAGTPPRANSDLEQLRELIRLGLEDGVPTLAGLASSLGKSTRSLQRHLADEGTTLRELFERVRMAEAERRLVAEEIDVGELAGALRYTDASAFGRAFKRWTGETPSDFRASRRRKR